MSDEENHIFVIGPARSGTTVVARAINLSPDCFLLMEGNIFLRGGAHSFRESFNQRKLAEGTMLHGKGSFLPGIVGEGGPEDVLSMLGKRYSRVGDKIALGPGMSSNVLLAEYMLRHHWSSTYIFCLRSPLETFSSQMRMFPVSAASIVKGWVEALILMLMIYGNSERCYFIMHDTLSVDQIAVLGERVGLRLSVEPNSIGVAYQATTSTAPLFFDGLDEAVKACCNAFNLIRESWSSATLRLRRSSGDFSLLEDAVKLLMPIIRSFEPEWSPLQSSLRFRAEGILDRLRELSEAQELGAEEAKLIVSDLASFASDRPETAYWTGLVGLAHQDFIGAEKAFTVALEAGYLPFWALTHRLQ
ncbi:MAG TPA: hypothetical protein VJ734_05885, partial [Nitrosospira sp.]|nr:hypothetical protein [Nitrosospira sp.]